VAAADEARRPDVSASVAPSGRAGLAVWFKPPLGIEAVWLAAAPFVLAVAALLSPIRPFDYFWSLVQGRAIVQLGRIPTENLFLHTVPVHAPFIEQPWLAQLAMFGAFRLGGHSANLLLLAGLLALAMAIALDTALRLGGKPRTVAVVALAVSPLLVLGSGVRTQMFAYPCFALILRWSLLRAPGRSLRAIVPSLVVSALWANLHGSFVLAPVIVALAAAGRFLAADRSQRDRWATLARGGRDAFLVGLAALANPHGARIYSYAAGLAGAVRVAGVSDVGEWLAPSMREPLGIAFYVLAVLGGLAAVLGRRRVVLAALVPHLGFVALSCASQRFLSWWALSAIVAFARIRGSDGPVAVRQGPSWPNVALLGLLLSLVLASFPGAPLFERAALRSHLAYPDARALGVESPVRLAQGLAQGYPGKLFHVQAVGGLLEWTLAADAPKPVAFVDQRFELTPAGVWQDYFAICNARGDWRGLLASYGVGTILIDAKEASPLLGALAADPAWRPMGEELAYHLFQRVDPQRSR
jgi:hypothetical protein